MKRAFEPNSRWSLKSSAVDGCLVGIALAAFHQVYRAISNNIPDDLYTHVIGETIAGAGATSETTRIRTAIETMEQWKQVSID